MSSEAAGNLTVILHATGFAARLALVDSDGQPLVQSDGTSASSVDPRIDLSVPAGDELVEVQSVLGGGSFQISAILTPAVPAFQTVPSRFSGYAPIAVGRFFGGNSPLDLVAPDGIHVGNGDGTFQSSIILGPLADPGWTVTAIIVGNFSGNSLPDIAFTEISRDGSTAALVVLQNQGNGQFEASARLRVDSQPVAIQEIDFGNGIVDLAVADAISGNVAIFMGDGLGNFVPGPILFGGIRPTALAAGSFGDGHVDLIVANRGDPYTGDGGGLTVFQSDGPRGFSASSTIPLASGPTAIAAGDWSRDGALDLAVAEALSGEVTILLNNGTGEFHAGQSCPVGGVPMAIIAGDFGNGQLDLATADTNSGEVSVLLGNGNGTFAPQARYGAGQFPRSLVAADWNGDGRADLAVANQRSGDISILLSQVDGTFQDQLSNPIGERPWPS